jgi:hypothetical protein
LEEIRAFERIEPSGRIEWWVDHLLKDRRSSDYLAERLARAYVGTEQGPFILFRRRRFVTWLSDRLFENRPYDQIVRELIGGSGLWTDTPAVNFVTATLDDNDGNQPDELRLAGRTARACLGIRLDCVQCHDDHLGGDWLQTDFHELAACFSEARSSLLGIRDEPGRKYEYTYLHRDQSEIVTPEFPVANSIQVDGKNRRERLANWLTHPNNEPFSRAIVNRMWALLFGRPLVEPIDNIPLDGPFPPALQTLARDFARHDFDLRRLVRQIVASRPFHLDSRSANASDVHESKWALFPLTRLRPEQVAGGILQACSLTTLDANSHIVVQLARFDGQRGFVERYGDSGSDEFGTQGGSIPQRLVMMNGSLVHERTKDDLVFNASTRIAALAKNDEWAIEVAYLTVLSRRPSAEEMRYFSDELGTTKEDERRKRMEDLYWTLLNSTEFSWNH